MARATRAVDKFHRYYVRAGRMVAVARPGEPREYGMVQRVDGDQVSVITFEGVQVVDIVYVTAIWDTKTIEGIIATAHEILAREHGIPSPNAMQVQQIIDRYEQASRE